MKESLLFLILLLYAGISNGQAEEDSLHRIWYNQAAAVTVRLEAFAQLIKEVFIQVQL